MAKGGNPVPEGYEVVYTAYITLRNGQRLYASAFGLQGISPCDP